MRQVVFVLMAKEPCPGETKTRLVPPLTEEQAAGLYRALLLDSIAMLTSLEWADFAIAISPKESAGYFQKITPAGTQIVPISGVDIGECLRIALGELLRLGYGKVIAVNADGPSLPGVYLQQAADALDDHDLVLGEGHDGGYYLVGMKKPHLEIFRNIHWSTDRVLAQTLERADKAGLLTFLTPQWYDVDRMEDIERLKKDLERLPIERLSYTRRFLTLFNR